MNAIASPANLLGLLGAEMAAGRRVPVLGPEILTLSPDPPVPVGARELSHRLAAKVAVPGRIKNNLWHSAQYIETSRHRVTLDRLMADIFKAIPEPAPLQRWLAGLERLPLIIDTWYDGAMAAALAGRTDWGLAQGASKARRRPDSPWCRAYDHTLTEVPLQAADSWATVLYKPHGAAQPAGDILASDSDYVEVLTEIDIETPIPDAVKARRQGRSMLFLGCRFYDQILRTFARSFLKHAGGPHYAVLPIDELTPNEQRFLEAAGITPIPLPLAEAAGFLCSTP